MKLLYQLKRRARFPKRCLIVLVTHQIAKKSLVFQGKRRERALYCESTLFNQSERALYRGYIINIDRKIDRPVDR